MTLQPARPYDFKRGKPWTAGNDRSPRPLVSTERLCRPTMQRVGVHLGACLLGFALALGGPTPSALAQDATTAEVTFWNSVKDSRNAAELQAYLSAYPQGTFAGLARVKLDALGGTGASTAPVQPASPRGVSVLTTQALIREAQGYLYNLNYSPSQAGRMDDATRKAIREWQTNNNRPVTGVIDGDDLASLRAAKPVTTWGALAFGPRGAFGAVWNITTRKEAEERALRECRKGSRGDRCSVLTAASTGCGASTHSTGVVRGTRHNNAFAAIRPTLDAARNAAMDQCRANARVPSACQLRTSFCANGSHGS